MRQSSFLASFVGSISALSKSGSATQYGAICYRRLRKDGTVEVLVISSRDTRRWVIPKGWPMAGKEPHEVAQREAFEEAGVVGKAKRKPLGYFHYLKNLDDGGKSPCLVQVHVLKVNDLLDKYPERGQRITEWVSCSEAATRVTEPELKGLFRLLEGRLAGNE